MKRNLDKEYSHGYDIESYIRCLGPLYLPYRNVKENLALVSWKIGFSLECGLDVDSFSAQIREAVSIVFTLSL